MPLREMKELLNGRYTLVRGPVTKDRLSETWIARDAFYDFCLVRVWPFTLSENSAYQRALWDGELRTLYRLSSSPAAEDSLLLMKDAGIDQEELVFVMALQGSSMQDYLSLETALAGRGAYPWLRTRDPKARKEIWKAFKTLAQGVALLHRQRVIHRNLNASAVFLDPNIGAPSMRLGGFEWSIRLGVPARTAPPNLWSLSKESFGPEGPRFGPENDWFGFGMLLSRVLLNLEPLIQAEPATRQELALARIEKANRKDLSELEQTVLLELLAIDPMERLAIDDLVLARIEGVAKSFEEVGALGSNEELVLVVDPRNNALQAGALEGGFQPDPGSKMETFDASNPIHTSRLVSFIREDLTFARVYSVPNAPYFILDGEALTFVISQFVHGKTGKASWDHAFVTNIGFVNNQGEGDSVVSLPEGIISVWSVGEVYRSRGQKNNRSWKSVLPQKAKDSSKKRDYEKFLDFVICGNQLELLKLSEEIFCCEVVGEDDTDPATEAIWIVESEARGDWKGVFGGGPLSLFEFLKREKESDRPKCDWVDLMSGDTTALFRRTVPDEEWWRVGKFDQSERKVLLYRQNMGKTSNVVPRGFLRTFGFYGQLELIRRRKEAIERLEDHAYLLEALTGPGNVKIDMGDLSRLPAPFPEDEVDLWKQTVLEDVLRTRPIYALQGPPGTGKTTLVANLVLQILTEDPVAQILITAQAHAALEVLRAKVAEGIGTVPLDERPIAVRLGGKTLGEGETEGGVEEVAAQILIAAVEELGQLSELSAFQSSWLVEARAMIGSLTQKGERSPGDFLELVKRSANVTYCTTSARDLEILASGEQSFDWSIIEEAGKVHGFDLALPLLAGHRWLLIGDQKQLEPFAYEEYIEILERLDSAVEALDSLPGTGGLVDIDWVRRWQALDGPGREEAAEFCKYWMKSFEIIYNKCSSIGGEIRRTENKAIGASAGWLRRQYRMHPSIAKIVSRTHYGGRLESMTKNDDGSPIEKVRHLVTAPKEIGSRAVVWLDVPWARYEVLCKEMGPREGLLKYGNRAECVAIHRFLSSIQIDDSFEDSLEIAVLSPYKQQLSKLRKELESLKLPRQFIFKEALGKSRLEGFRKAEIAHTVDSFQGNEADIVLVSLVRNNNTPPSQGLGFLRSPSRINVLFSRAQRLLVLVGSWDFFEHQISAVDLKDPGKDFWHWAKTLETLREMFDSGEAVRIKGDWQW